MATTSDRPRGAGTSGEQPPAGTPSRLDVGPRWSRGARASRARRLRGGLYLFGPLGLCVLVLVAAIVAVMVGGGESGPATGAARLVPGNALIYIHVSTDTSRPAVRQALAVTKRLPDSPLLFAAIDSRLGTLLSGSSNAPVDFATAIRPWLGSEAAFAVLDTTTSSAGSLTVLDVRRPARARRFVASVGAQPDGRFRGVALLRQPSGTEFAFVGHYLLLGQKSSVESAIYVDAGRAPSLATTPVYERAAGPEAPDRVLDAYASAAGIRRALLPRPGALGALAVLLDDPALSASTLSITPTRVGLHLALYRPLDPRLIRHSGSPAQFSPTLAGALPAGSTLLLDVDNVPRAAPRLLAAAATAGVAARFGPLLSRLGSGLAAEGVDVQQVLSIFSRETALALVPTGSGGSAPVLVTRTSHPGATRDLLAGLAAPLTQLFAPPGSGPGQVPEVNDVQVAGTTIAQLTLAPGFQLDYALTHGLVVISTSLDGVAGVIAHHQPLTGRPAYGSTLGSPPDRVTSLLFSDLPQLLRLGEQTGLIQSTRLATLWPDLAKIRAIGLISTRGELDTTTELSLQIR